MTILSERATFQTARQLITALERMAVPGSTLDEMYVQDCDGVELDTVELMQESLSDGSVVFNIVLSTEGDPNS